MSLAAHVSTRDVRKKNGKEHRYGSIVENKHIAGGKVRLRHVLYLGEINASRERAWRKSIEVLDGEADRPRTLALFAEDRCDGLPPDSPIVGYNALANLCVGLCSVDASMIRLRSLGFSMTVFDGDFHETTVDAKDALYQDANFPSTYLAFP